MLLYFYNCQLLTFNCTASSISILYPLFSIVTLLRNCHNINYEQRKKRFSAGKVHKIHYFEGAILLWVTVDLAVPAVVGSSSFSFSSAAAAATEITTVAVADAAADADAAAIAATTITTTAAVAAAAADQLKTVPLRSDHVPTKRGAQQKVLSADPLYA